MDPRDQDPVEAGFMAGDGDNDRLEVAVAEFTTLQEARTEHLMTSMVIAMVFCFSASLVWWSFMVTEAIIIAMYGHENVYQSYGDRTFLVLGTFFPAAIQVITYYMYNVLETDAFQNFEKLFPPQEDGQGDARRLEFFYWSVMIKKIWIRRKKIKKIFIENIKNILIFLCGLAFMWDVANATNELYFIFRELSISIKFIIIGPLIYKAHKLNYIPDNIVHFLMFNIYADVYIPVVYRIPESITTLYILLWIPRLIGLWYLYKKIQQDSTRYHIPTLPAVMRLLTGRFGDDMNEQLTATMILFARWLEVTNQIPRGRQQRRAPAAPPRDVVVPPLHENEADEESNSDDSEVDVWEFDEDFFRQEFQRNGNVLIA